MRRIRIVVAMAIVAGLGTRVEAGEATFRDQVWTVIDGFWAQGIWRSGYRPEPEVEARYWELLEAIEVEADRIAARRREPGGSPWLGAPTVRVYEVEDLAASTRLVTGRLGGAFEQQKRWAEAARVYEREAGIFDRLFGEGNRFTRLTRMQVDQNRRMVRYYSEAARRYAARDPQLAARVAPRGPDGKPDWGE